MVRNRKSNYEEDWEGDEIRLMDLMSLGKDIYNAFINPMDENGEALVTWWSLEEMFIRWKPSQTPDTVRMEMDLTCGKPDQDVSVIVYTVPVTGETKKTVVVVKGTNMETMNKIEGLIGKYVK